MSLKYQLSESQNVVKEKQNRKKLFLMSVSLTVVNGLNQVLICLNLDKLSVKIAIIHVFLVKIFKSEVFQ